MMERLDEGAAKWLTLGVVIVALEAVGNESLTHACGRALDSRIGKVVVPAVMGLTVSHLMDWLPRRADPFYLITEGVDHVRDKVSNL